MRRGNVDIGETVSWWGAGSIAEHTREPQAMSTAPRKEASQTAAEKRAAEAQLRELVTKFTPEGARLVASMRRSLRKRLPTAHEVVYEYRDCFVVSFSPSGHGYEGVLAIRGSEEGVRLYFNRGKGLPDPEKLLRGSAQARWVEIERASALARPAVNALIDEAIDRNPVPFAPTGRGAVVVRSTKAKPRPRAAKARRTP